MKIRWNEVFLGPAKDPLNPRVFHAITLAAFFAWVGLGADGLSSSCYGPEEAFLGLLKHPILALPLAGIVVLTVCILSASYALLIEAFPSGGGGYLVSTKLLGKYPGLACGWALILDYILTIAVSISSAVDAILSNTPELADLKIYIAIAVLVILMLLNLRGVKESILVLMPIFLAFVVTHLLGILTALFGNFRNLLGRVADSPAEIVRAAEVEGGWIPLLVIFLAAYSIGAGTYTGIEAVSNSMQILREPRVATGRRTMLYMAISLSIVAAGVLVGYLLFEVAPQKGKTLNAVLFEGIFRSFDVGGIPLGKTLVVITLLSEGALLFVASQAGFIGGPRTLATMALDRWVPTQFSHLSNRLVVQHGVLFMGLAALAFIFFTNGNVKILVILYSISVFLTFTLSQLGMCLHWIRSGLAGHAWKRKLSINGIGLLLSVSVLSIMIGFNFMRGGWMTLVLISVGIFFSVVIRRHYERVRRSLRDLDLLVEVPPVPSAASPPGRAPGPAAILLVGGFNGLGMHSFLTILRLFPNHFKNFIFVSVGVVDYEEFKGVEEIEKLRRRTVEGLEKYVTWSKMMGLYAEARHAIGTDLVDEIENLSREITKEYSGAIFFGGQLVFEDESPFTRTLHSQAAFEIQRRLQFCGLPMVLLPVRIRTYSPKKRKKRPETAPARPEG